MFKWVSTGLCVIFIFLQMRLWFGSSGIQHVVRDMEQLKSEQRKLSSLQQRNQQLMAQIELLKSTPLGFEESARNELGLIKPNETFYIVPLTR